MKDFKKVVLIAKNLPAGSYAAGCPENRRGSGGGCFAVWGGDSDYCIECERTR